MKMSLFAAALVLLALAAPAMGQDLNGTLAGTWFSNDNAAELVIVALPPGFNNDYVVAFSTDMDAATGICLGEGLAMADRDTGDLSLILEDNVTLIIQVQYTDAGQVLRIDQDPGPYCGMGATIIGIYERAP